MIWAGSAQAKNWAVGGQDETRNSEIWKRFQLCSSAKAVDSPFPDSMFSFFGINYVAQLPWLSFDAGPKISSRPSLPGKPWTAFLSGEQLLGRRHEGRQAGPPRQLLVHGALLQPPLNPWFWLKVHGKPLLNHQTTNPNHQLEGR